MGASYLCPKQSKFAAPIPTAVEAGISRLYKKGRPRCLRCTCVQIDQDFTQRNENRKWTKSAHSVLVSIQRVQLSAWEISVKVGEDSFLSFIFLFISVYVYTRTSCQCVCVFVCMCIMCVGLCVLVSVCVGVHVHKYAWVCFIIIKVMILIII